MAILTEEEKRRNAEELTSEEPVESFPHAAGSFARERMLPAIGTVGRKAGGVATIVPRSLINVGGKFARGFRGEAAKPDSFKVFPFDRSNQSDITPSNQERETVIEATTSEPDILEPKPLSLANIEQPIDRQPIAEQPEPLLQRITTPSTSGQMNFASAEDKERYDTLIGEGVYASPSPSTEVFALKDEDNKYNVVEVMQGSDSPPALRKPFTSPKRFATRTGWDKDGNPIYDDGSAAMNAANQGIADYNKAVLRSYEDRNTQFAAQEGSIPLSKAGVESSEAQTAADTFKLNRLQELAQAQDAYSAATTPEGQASARRSLQAFGQDVGEERKRDVRVIKVPDGFGGLKDEIRVDDGTGRYVRAMAEPVQRLPKTHKAIKLLRDNIDDPLYRRKFQEKYGYLPSQAELNN